MAANKTLLDFSGGMNAKASPLVLRDREAELIVNYTLDRVGGLTKRLGNAAFGNQPVAGTRVNGLYNFDNSGGQKQLMVANNSAGTNGVLYSYESGTWTARITNLTASRGSRFATFVGNVFHVNGVAADWQSSTNGTSWSTTVNLPASRFTALDIAVFEDRVYASKVSTSRVYFSSLPSAGAITWDTTNDWFDVNPDDGDQVTALENNGNRLLIFKNRALYRWTFGQVEPDRIIGVGTSAAETVKTNFDLGITFFANQYGVYAYTGGRPKCVSRKIQKYIDAVPMWGRGFDSNGSSVKGFVDDDHYFLSVGNITVDGKLISNAVFVYTVSLDAWTIESRAQMPTAYAKFQVDDGTVFFPERYYFGASNGQVYQFQTTNADAGTAIQGELVSKEYLLSFPERTNVEWVDVFSAAPALTSITYDLDRAVNQFQLGTLDGRVTSLKVAGPRECNSLRLYATENSTVASSLEGFNVTHEPKAKREENAVRTKR